MLDLSQNAVTDQLQIGQATHPGRSGKNNEDYYGVFSVATAGGECVVAAVTDGIGGSVGGEQASRLAINTMHASLNDPLYVATSLGQRLDQAIRLANRQIYETSQNQPALAGMGTTVVAVALDGDRLYVAHAGDSRAYLIRGGRAHQLTLDHSWAQEAIEANRITPEEAKTHPNRHVIRRFLGINEEVETDPRVVDPAQGISSGERPATVASPILTQPGDAIVLCSDGLTDEVSDEEIARIVSKHVPADAARRLVDAANAAGGSDNITAVILQRGGGKPSAAGRSRLAAYGLALMAALIVGALGWLIASGALFGKPDGGVAAADATPSLATDIPAAVLATSTPVAGAAAVAAARPSAAATATATADVAPSATAAEPTPAATFPATAEPATAEPATSEPATSEPTTSEPGSSEPATSEPAASVQPTSMSTAVPVRDLANPGGGIKSDPGAAPTETTIEATGETAIAASAPPAEAAALAVAPTSTAIPTITSTAQQPGPSASPTAPPTSTPVGPKISTPTVTATPTIAPRSPAAPASTSKPVPPTPLPSPATNNGMVQPPPPPSAPAAASAAAGGPHTIDPLSPPSGTSANENDSVPFAWNIDAPLELGQVFELVFWNADGGNPNSGKAINEASPNPYATVAPGRNLPAGSYKWGIFLAQKEPWGRIRFLGEGGSLSVSTSGSDNGSDEEKCTTCRD